MVGAAQARGYRLVTTWVVTGASGMLGTDVLARLAELHATDEVVALGHSQLDITDPTSVDEAMSGDDVVVVNCAAWTDVDGAESAEASAFAVNAVGPAVLAAACARTGARMVHVSTDYVFAGNATQPYGEDAGVAPASAYGRTKVAGEWAVRAALPEQAWVVRTAWLYGANGKNFVTTMRGLAKQHDQLRVVDDQWGQPTWTADVAASIVALVDADAASGTYHATSSGMTTWYGLAREVLRLDGLDPDRVSAVDSSAYPRPAARPAWSVLGHDAWARAGLDPIGDWSDRLAVAWPTLG